MFEIQIELVSNYSHKNNLQNINSKTQIILQNVDVEFCSTL